MIAFHLRAAMAASIAITLFLAPFASRSLGAMAYTETWNYVNPKSDYEVGHDFFNGWVPHGFTSGSLTLNETTGPFTNGLENNVHLQSNLAAAGANENGIKTSGNGSTAHFLGDYGAAQVTGISIDTRRTAGSQSGMSFQIRLISGSTTWSGFFYTIGPGIPMTWTTYSVPIDPNWIDVEAQAAKSADSELGWARLSGSASWQDTLSNVTEVRIFHYRNNTSTGYTAQYDNLTLHAIPVPEPATGTLALLTIAGLAAGIRQRRFPSKGP